MNAEHRRLFRTNLALAAALIVLPATAIAGPWKTMDSSVGEIYTKADGVAYGGEPFYAYAEDAQPGDVKGDGVGGVWHVAKVE